MTKIFETTIACVALASLCLSACADAGGSPAGAESLAEQESPLYVLSTAIWPSPTIAVCWESAPEATATERAWVRNAVAQTWEAHSRVTFSGWGTCAAGSTGIRIGVSDTGPHVKALGSGLNGMSNGMVLNFTFNNWSPVCQSSREFCIRAIAVHEFGHALSFAHEQNRPDTPDTCTDAPQGTNGDTTVGAWDLSSVMNYCNPQWNGNGQLSAGDIAGVRQFYGTGRFNYQGDGGWWDSGPSYSAGAIAGRTVAGDFNGDGRDDVAMFYKYAPDRGRVHVLLSTGASFSYQGDGGWWDSGASYSPDAVAGRMVGGDFNGDGRDDIAMFYASSASSGRIHVLLSTGSSFSYQGDAGWWDSGASYSASAFTGRMVAGDFNGDGRDDVAMLYKYAPDRGRVHVLLSTGASFSYQGDGGWWDSGASYSPDAVTGRTVAGDFNGDGRDDVAMIYRYAADRGRAHVLLSTGASFSYQGDAGWWDSGPGFSPDAVAGRVVGGDFNGDGRGDLAMLYEQTSSTSRANVLLSSGSAFQYQNWWDSGASYSAAAATGRMVAGDFNGDGSSDISIAYPYPNSTTRSHVLLAQPQ